MPTQLENDAHSIGHLLTLICSCSIRSYGRGCHNQYSQIRAWRSSHLARRCLAQKNNCNFAGRLLSPNSSCQGESGNYTTSNAPAGGHSQWPLGSPHCGHSTSPGHSCAGIVFSSQKTALGLTGFTVGSTVGLTGSGPAVGFTGFGLSVGCTGLALPQFIQFMGSQQPFPLLSPPSWQ